MRIDAEKSVQICTLVVTRLGCEAETLPNMYLSLGNALPKYMQIPG
jgi:hypothetical protein